MGKIEVKCAHDAMVALEKLIPNPKNPNFHPPKQVEALCKIIQSTGWRAPITISRQSGLIVRGHGRFMAAVEMECDEVPVDYQDYESEAEELADLVADNRIAELSNLDDDLLRDLMENINSFEFDMELTGFEISEIAELINTEKQGLIDDDEVPEVVEDPVTKTGDLFYLGGHRLLCGDATNKSDVERLLGGGSPALMVTDPPYGVEYDPAWRNEAAEAGHLAYAARRVGEVTNDDRIDWSDAWRISPSTVFYCWHAGRYASQVQNSIETCGFVVRSQIIWAKSNFPISRGHYHWRHEPCWYAIKKGSTANWIGDRKQTTLWQINLDKNTDGGHSTQKPVECMLRAIKNHSGDVYDPFIGSGTTLIAAEKESRMCYGMEIDPHYCDVVVKRWENFTGKKAELIG